MIPATCTCGHEDDQHSYLTTACCECDCDEFADGEDIADPGAEEEED